MTIEPDPCGAGFSPPHGRVRPKPDPQGIWRAFAIVAILFALAQPARADPPPAAQAEIDHLLAFVAASACTFIRNGSSHPGPEARDHLSSKFRLAKGSIGTTEEFIRYVATESSMSREPYQVKCGATMMPAGVWLADELKRYRATAARPAR